MDSVRGPELSDEELVERARRGDAAAFEALVLRYYRAAYAVARAITSSAMDAEDVCQDAFVRALERLDRLRQPASFAPWLLQIVRNRARNLLSYRRVRAADSLDEVRAASGEDSGRRAERSELQRRLGLALKVLSPAQREVVLLHDMDGWKHREIGEALGISEVMSRQHLFNARRLLREQLGAEFGEDYSDA